MRLTKKKNNEYVANTKINTRSQQFAWLRQLGFKLGQLEDIEDELGFGLNELIQMLINGVWEVGGVDSKTMKPEPSCLLFYYVYGIDFKNRCLKVMRATGYNKRSIERNREFVFSSLHLCKYKKKCLGGWALTKEELEEKNYAANEYIR